MKHFLTKADVESLDFDSKCVLFEEFLCNDYNSGKLEINFWIDPNFEEKDGAPLPLTPPEITKEQMKKMLLLLDKLTDKLFFDGNTVEITEKLFKTIYEE